MRTLAKNLRNGLRLAAFAADFLGGWVPGAGDLGRKPLAVESAEYGTSSAISLASVPENIAQVFKVEAGHARRRICYLLPPALHLGERFAEVALCRWSNRSDVRGTP